MAGRYASAPRMGAHAPHHHSMNSGMNGHHHGVVGGVASSGGPAEPIYASNRSLTPSRYVTSYDNHADSSALGGSATGAVSGGTPSNSNGPSSSGLIRLSLKKPMGIVFEPMYDPNQKSVQRGVRICDLPRTGAAALSRKLQVGDELLQINDKTVSRLNFDQIMDFIIEADPECVNLLFRRPRKEILQARQGVQQKLNAAANKDNPSTVKWVDEDMQDTGGAGGGGGVAGSGTRADASGTGDAGGAGAGHRKSSKLGKDGKSKSDGKSSGKDASRTKISKRSKKASVSEDEDETQQSSTAGDDSYAKPTTGGGGRSRKKSKSRRDPYESESFLDILIDTICANSNNVCRDAFRRNDDEYFSEDDESFVTDAEDESTYVTYDESMEQRGGKKNRKKPPPDEETVEDTRNDREDDERRKHKAHQRKDKTSDKSEAKQQQHQPQNHQKPHQQEKKKYEDDGTLESVDSAERLKQDPVLPATQPPLGLAPQQNAELAPKSLLPVPQQAEPDDDVVNPAPIREVEYDDRIDHGADVSVMESLGGPSLLIEKQRAAAMAAQVGTQDHRVVPGEIMEKYGLDYPVGFGLTREQMIEADPLMFYTYVVKGLLEEHEPEKVRLLDKLLAKYKGREDHLVQKLSVRYDRPVSADQQTPSIPEDDHLAFSDAVTKNKASSSAAAAVHTAKERILQIGDQQPGGAGGAAAMMLGDFDDDAEWPEKETKEPELGDDIVEGEEASSSGSEFSRDSVDGTSPAVIAQVSELLNYVYGKTSVPGQIDRVSTIMRAYEGREAVLLELLETKALIKANKEKENADNLPSFLRNSQQHMAQAQRNADDVGAAAGSELPPVTPMATQPVTDDMSSMSGVSSPIQERGTSGIVSSTYNSEEVEVTHRTIDLSVDMDGSRVTAAPSSTRSGTKPPVTPDRGQSKAKKKGLFSGLFSRKRDGAVTPSAARAGSRVRAIRKVKG